jgi:hypoxia up-regulated 1
MIQANKVKHVLSANTDFPVFVDALHDDINYQTHVSRAKFEEICHDLLERAAAPIHAALEMANVTIGELTAVEMIGGAMRVPKVQEVVAAALGGMELGMHLNSDESMALGAAFHGANVSTSFKVRHVGMSDVNPFPVAVDLVSLSKKGEANDSETKKGLFGIGKKKREDVWSKHSTIFKRGSKLGSKKTIAFSMDEDVHVQVNYEEDDLLPVGTGASIEQYDVEGVAEFAKEMKDKGLEGAPKVSLQFEMSTSGLTSLIKAEMVMEEVVIVEEEVEVDDDEEGAAADAAAEKGAEEKKDEAKTEEAKKEDETKTEDAKSDDAAASDESKKDDTSDEKKEGDAAAEEKKDEKKEEPKKKKTKMVQKVRLCLCSTNLYS